MARLHAVSAGVFELVPPGQANLDALTLKRSDFAKKVTLLSQSRPVPHGLSVKEVVELGRHPHRGRFRAADPEGPAMVDQAMAMTGVSDLALADVAQLSGGQLQRVWLASALAQDTSVLLLDEPSNHLDLRYKVEIFDLMHTLAKEHGVAIGVVLHDLDEAADIADDIAVLSEGRIVQSGSVEAAFDAQLLSKVYGIEIRVQVNPFTGRPSAKAFGRRTTHALPA